MLVYFKMTIVLSLNKESHMSTHTHNSGILKSAVIGWHILCTSAWWHISSKEFGIAVVTRPKVCSELKSVTIFILNFF